MIQNVGGRWGRAGAALTGSAASLGFGLAEMKQTVIVWGTVFLQL